MEILYEEAEKSIKAYTFQDKVGKGGFGNVYLATKDS